MAKIDMPPTRSSLRKVRADLNFAYEGFDLLEQKREILVMEIVKKINRIKIIEEHFRNALGDAYRGYRTAAMTMGSPMLTLKAVPKSPFFHLI